jgi:pyridoxal phosphate enzyme (YggS family)
VVSSRKYGDRSRNDRQASNKNSAAAEGSMTDQETTQARLNAVRGRITRAAEQAGRDPAEIELVAVTKTFGAADIRPALDAGQRMFGENRVQEARSKWPPLRERYADIELHLIGPLQSNKARDAVQLFDVIQTVDRPKIADALAEAIARSGRKVRLFIQVNTGEEAQKAGVSFVELGALIRHCRDLELAVDGLMCIPPLEDDPAPHFARLARAASEFGLKKLSMGMSADFETAIAEGATHVRVGSAIFGVRR